MRFVASIVGLALLLMVLRDAFETIILPRRVRRKFQFTSICYRATGKIWPAAGSIGITPTPLGQ
jgi:hypothetical protein